MRHSIKKMPASLCAAAFCAAVLAAGTAAANEFTGSITFGASGVTTDNPILADDTMFNLTGVTISETTGVYATLGSPALNVLFNGFVFTGNSAVATVKPLWSYNIGTTEVTFDATSVKAQWQNTVGSSGEWIISGTGMADISGYTDTPGTYTINLSDSGNLAVAFDATAAAHTTVPDGGSTVALLGAALTALGLFTRKFCC